MDVVATEPQSRMILSQKKHPLFVAGFGAGKTETMMNIAAADASHSASALIGLYAPTYDLVKLVLAPRMMERLSLLGVPHKWNKSDNVIYTSFPRFGDFVLRTLDNPARIVGYETYRAHVDELDTLKMTHAEEAWNKVLGRCRQKPDGIMKPFNRVSAYTTPEGFRFAYKRWVTQGGLQYEIVQAPTTSNPFLPDDYVDTLRATYPAGLIDAYIEGKFVNLTSGTVYRFYDRLKRRSGERIEAGDVLHIGQDFNVGKMASVVYVERSNGFHAVDELKGILDTPALLEVLEERYKGHEIILYPDASGASRKTVGAAKSDLILMRAAGYRVRAKRTNPPVKDRILAVNTGFDKGRIWVNDTACPVFAASLEQQAYDANGEPDKSGGADHHTDAGGYPVAWLMPVRKPKIEEAAAPVRSRRRDYGADEED